MPTKRTVIDRPRRRTFSPEVIALFAKLDRLHLTNPYAARPRELAEKLGLIDEYWSGNSVLDRSREPSYPPWCVAHGDWHTCRAVREQLLAAAREAGRRH